ESSFGKEDTSHLWPQDPPCRKKRDEDGAPDFVARLYRYDLEAVASLPNGFSTIVSLAASQYTFFPAQYDCAAIMQATEWAKPSFTVAAGCWRERMQSSQLPMCSSERSSMPIGGSLSPGSTIYFDSRFLSMSASSSCVPFSSMT